MGTPSSSFTLQHHAWMLAIAVSQRAAWVLVLRSLNYRVSDAVSAHVAPRNGGVSVPREHGMFAAHGTLSSSPVLRHRAWMLANAVSQSSGAGAAIAQDGRCELNAPTVGMQNTGALVSVASEVHKACATRCSTRTRASQLQSHRAAAAPQLWFSKPPPWPKLRPSSSPWLSRGPVGSAPAVLAGPAKSRRDIFTAFFFGMVAGGVGGRGG